MIMAWKRENNDNRKWHSVKEWKWWVLKWWENNGSGVHISEYQGESDQWVKNNNEK